MVTTPITPANELDVDFVALFHVLQDQFDKGKGESLQVPAHNVSDPEAKAAIQLDKRRHNRIDLRLELVVGG